MTSFSRGSSYVSLAWNGKWAVSAFYNTDYLQQGDIDFYLMYYYGYVVQGTVASNIANDQSSNTQPGIAYDPVDNLYGYEPSVRGRAREGAGCEPRPLFVFAGYV